MHVLDDTERFFFLKKSDNLDSESEKQGVDSQSIKLSVLTGFGLSADCKGCWVWRSSRGGEKGQTACLEEVSARVPLPGDTRGWGGRGPSKEYGFHCLYLDRGG